MKFELTSEQCRFLKALAHQRNPVVMIGNNGLTEAVLREIAINLAAHELIKIRVQGDDREARVAMYDTICQDLDAAPVQHIGKLLVIYRPNNEVNIALPGVKVKPKPLKKPAKAKFGRPSSRASKVKTGY